MRRKCDALVLFVSVSDAARLRRLPVSSQKAALFAVKTKETKMRVITVSELRRLNRAQLFSLQVQMQAVLTDLTTASVEYEFVRATLDNIRQVLSWTSLSL